VTEGSMAKKATDGKARQEAGLEDAARQKAPGAATTSEAAGPKTEEVVPEMLISGAKIVRLAGLLGERAELERKMELLDIALAPAVLEMWADLKAGKLPDPSGPQVTISVYEKRTVAWKQEYIKVKGKSEAEKILAGTIALKYHYVVINNNKAPHSIETLKKQAEEAEKARL
jgi:hypothetical protein